MGPRSYLCMKTQISEVRWCWKLVVAVDHVHHSFPLVQKFIHSIVAGDLEGGAGWQQLLPRRLCSVVIQRLKTHKQLKKLKLRPLGDIFVDKFDISIITQKIFAILERLLYCQLMRVYLILITDIFLCSAIGVNLTQNLEHRLLFIHTSTLKTKTRILKLHKMKKKQLLMFRDSCGNWINM